MEETTQRLSTTDDVKLLTPYVPVPTDFLRREERDFSPVFDENERRKIFEEKLRLCGLALTYVGAYESALNTTYVIRRKEGTTERDVLNAKPLFQLYFRSPFPVRVMKDSDGYYGIRVANRKQRSVSLCEAQSATEETGKTCALPIAMGQDEEGEYPVADIARMGNVLLYGASGSGKTTFIRTTICSLAMRFSPERVRFFFLSVKDAGEYRGLGEIPHTVAKYLRTAAEEEEKASGLLWLTREMHARMDAFNEAGVKTLDEYNAKSERKLPYLLVIVDEGEELMSGEDSGTRMVEDVIRLLGSSDNAVGIAFLYATENGKRDLLTDKIVDGSKTRVVFRNEDPALAKRLCGDRNAEDAYEYGDASIRIGMERYHVKCTQATGKNAYSIVDFVVKNNNFEWDEGVRDFPMDKGKGKRYLAAETYVQPTEEDRKKLVAESLLDLWGTFVTPRLDMFDADDTEKEFARPETIKRKINKFIKSVGLRGQARDVMQIPGENVVFVETGSAEEMRVFGKILSPLAHWLDLGDPAFYPIDGKANECELRFARTLDRVPGLRSMSERPSSDDEVVRFRLGADDKGEWKEYGADEINGILLAGEDREEILSYADELLTSLVLRYAPDRVRLVVIERDEEGFLDYNGLPHMLFGEPISERTQIVNALRFLQKEGEDRLAEFPKAGVSDFDEYNEAAEKKMPLIVVLFDAIDEWIGDRSGKEHADALFRNAALFKKTGIRIVCTASRKPEALDGRYGFDLRLVFPVSEEKTSRAFFAGTCDYAAYLYGNGDAYVAREGQDETERLVVPRSSEELKRGARTFIRDRNAFTMEKDLVQKILRGEKVEERQNKSKESDDESDEAAEDDLMWRALRICVEANYVSPSFLQRKLLRGYNAIMGILSDLTDEGYIERRQTAAGEKYFVAIGKEDFIREWEKRFGKYN